MDTDLRSALRAAVTYPVRLSCDSKTGEGTVINLSVPGCAIETDLPVEPGDYVELRVMAPDQARPLDVELAKVRWTACHTVGIEFIRVRYEHQNRIERLIRPLLEESISNRESDRHQLTAV